MKTASIKKYVITFVCISVICAFQSKAQSGDALPIASDTILGGIKVGEGLKMNQSTGVLSLTSIPITDSNNSIISSGITSDFSGAGKKNIILGYNAGQGSYHPNSMVMIGENAGNGSLSDSGNNNFIGNLAGYSAKAGFSNFIGYAAGKDAGGTNTGAVFIGRYAGCLSTSSDGVVFIGGSAGDGAKNTTHSCFIAPRAGYQASNVSKGIYIGYEAGAYSNASYCILIGENAGRSLSSTNKIGNNNIILGNGTTLPGGTTNSFNIGNVLYGTGIQATTDSYPTYTPKSDGRIGIGVISPQASLHVNGTMLVNGNVEFGSTNNTWLKISDDRNMRVNGTITATEVNVKADVWADYVFSEGYRLPSLSEVSKHIEENKHLPGIPSAKDVEENGINLSEMNAKLLQKIEELTLYVIELNNEIQELKSSKESRLKK